MTAGEAKPRPLVIGIGNRFRGDDGIGPVVVDLVRTNHGAAVDTAIVDGDLSDLAISWRPDQAVVVVDAMVSGRVPGTIAVLDDRAVASAAADRLQSSHGVGLADAVALARALGRLPASLTVVAIEGRSFGHGRPLSGPVVAAAPAAVDRIADLVGLPAVRSRARSGGS